MKIDIVLVLYNSDKWLQGCVKALSEVDYDLSDLHLIWVDNAASPATTAVLQDLQKQYPGFGGFTLLQNARNQGFGVACNQGAAKGTSPYLFFLNTDTEVFPDVFTALQGALEAANENVAGFECRQVPFETGHIVDPNTMETTWSSAAAWLVRRSAFEKADGFDKHLFMYCEDVDLSWRLRAVGYTLSYVPNARVNHFTYGLDVKEMAPTKLSEYAGSFYGNLLMRYKYGSLKDILEGHAMYLGALRRPRHFPYVRRVLAKNYLKHFVKLWPFWFWRWTHSAQHQARTSNFEGGFSPERGVWAFEESIEQPLVSVVMRTMGRPETLRKTLDSLRHQIYKNFEVVVVEDGPPQSQQMVETEFPFLNIRYFSTGKNIGRGKAGNFGLKESKGLYCNFLDDDDYFYPDHIALLVSTLQQNKGAELVTASSMAMEADVVSRSPYELEIKDIYHMRFERMDNLLLCQSCLMPIQSVMFKRELFERYGGLHEEVDGNEDWYMWMKYFAYARRINYNKVDIFRATSLFLVPSNKEQAKQRLDYYKQFEEELLRSKDIRFTATPLQMRAYYYGLIGDMLHLQQQGKLEKFLKGYEPEMMRWNLKGEDLAAPPEYKDK